MNGTAIHPNVHRDRRNRPTPFSNTAHPILRLATAAALAVVLVLRVAVAGLVAAPPAEVAVLVEKARPATAVLVSVDPEGQWKSFGTGFFISADGLLVTARHVAQAEESLLAVTQDGRRHPVTVFLGEDRDYDIAVLRIDGSRFKHLRLSRILPRTNQWVALVSPTDQWGALFNRTNVPPVCSTGKVRSVLHLPGLWTGIATTAPARPGQSGSPLLNQAGEVIGVVPYLSQEQQATASPVTVVQAIIAKVGAAQGVAFRQRPRTGGAVPLVMDVDFRAGYEAASRGDWTETERRMKLAAERFPESALPLAFVAAAGAKRAAWEEVHDGCVKALRLQPDSAFCLLLDGTSLVMLGRLSEGAAAARKSLEIGLPDAAMQAAAWELQANAETVLGHPGRARKALDELQRLDPVRAATLRHRLEVDSRRSTPDAKKK